MASISLSAPAMPCVHVSINEQSLLVRRTEGSSREALSAALRGLVDKKTVVYIPMEETLDMQLDSFQVRRNALGMLQLTSHPREVKEHLPRIVSPDSQSAVIGHVGSGPSDELLLFCDDGRDASGLRQANILFSVHLKLDVKAMAKINSDAPIRDLDSVILSIRDNTSWMHPQVRHCPIQSSPTQHFGFRASHPASATFTLVLLRSIMPNVTGRLGLECFSMLTFVLDKNSHEYPLFQRAHLPAYIPFRTGEFTAPNRIRVPIGSVRVDAASTTPLFRRLLGPPVDLQALQESLLGYSHSILTSLANFKPGSRTPGGDIMLNYPVSLQYDEGLFPLPAALSVPIVVRFAYHLNAVRNRWWREEDVVPFLLHVTNWIEHFFQFKIAPDNSERALVRFLRFVPTMFASVPEVGDHFDDTLLSMYAGPQSHGTDCEELSILTMDMFYLLQNYGERCHDRRVSMLRETSLRFELVENTVTSQAPRLATDRLNAIVGLRSGASTSLLHTFCLLVPRRYWSALKENKMRSLSAADMKSMRTYVLDSVPGLQSCPYETAPEDARGLEHLFMERVYYDIVTMTTLEGVFVPVNATNVTGCSERDFVMLTSSMQRRRVARLFEMTNEQVRTWERFHAYFSRRKFPFIVSDACRADLAVFRSSETMCACAMPTTVASLKESVLFCENMPIVPLYLLHPIE